MEDYKEGDHVFVLDPEYGEKPGVIHSITGNVLYIQGPHIDAVRVFTWTVDLSFEHVAAMVRKA